MICRICETRRPRRYCPGVGGDICSMCCGKEREVSVDCPFECEYLVEARVHDRVPEPDPDTFPNADIRVTERFLEEHQELLAYMGVGVLRAARDTPGAVDFDIREALESLIRTLRTAQSGLIYESRPVNPYAASIYGKIQEAFDEYRKGIAQRVGIATVRDAELLGILAFLQRLEVTHNNGRRRGRAFVDFLRGQFGTFEEPESSLLA